MVKGRNTFSYTGIDLLPAAVRPLAAEPGYQILNSVDDSFNIGF